MRGVQGFQKTVAIKKILPHMTDNSDFVEMFHRRGQARRSAQPSQHGSCIAVCATDLPLSIQQLRRLALRPLLGLTRAGSYAAEGSGEIGIAFGTTGGTAGGEGVGDDVLNRCFAAAFEAARESVYNCLVAARPAQRRDGTMQPRFPAEAAASAGRDRLG